MYVGTDVDAVIAAGASSSDPTVLFGALIGALHTFDATDWTARANRMADEIKRQGPDVISLNEISTVARRGLGDYGVTDNTTDFLPIFLSALAARRLDYRLVGQVKNTDVIIPLSINPATGEIIAGPDGLPAAFVSLVDYDVMLARRGVAARNVTAKNYQAYLPVNLGPIPVAIKRGYVGADLTVFGQTFRVVSTHPEPRTPVKEIQEAQVAELLADLSATTLPVVVAGDLNSEPTDPANSPFDQMTRAGFTDMWVARIGRPEPGATCCHSPDLRSTVDAGSPPRLCVDQGGRAAAGGTGCHDGLWRRGARADFIGPLAVRPRRSLRGSGPAARSTCACHADPGQSPDGVALLERYRRRWSTKARRVGGDHRAKPLLIEAFAPLTPVLRCLYPRGNLSISNPFQHQILFVTEQLSRDADGIVARCVPARPPNRPTDRRAA